MPTVSVVTASWNQGNYIAECIESVKESSVDVEHIIVDNCSDDETQSVLQGSSGITALIEKDNGQSDAFNKGVSLATGDWILWLNADDYLFPEALARLVDQIAKSPSANIIYGHTQFVDEKGENLRTLFQIRWRYWMSYFGLSVIPTSGTLFRRELLLDAPLDINFHIVMDSEWCLRVGKFFIVATIPFRTIAFRVTDDNKTSLSIRTGKLTSRHAKERLMLAERYPYYGKGDERKRGFFVSLGLWAVRKLLRIYVLFSKVICKLTAK